MGPSRKHLILDLEPASRTRSNQFEVGGLAGREESDGSPVASIRASAARIRRITGSAACLEAQADEALLGTRRHRFCLVTRQRRRVTMRIRRLAGAFAIAFARNHLGKRADIPVRIAFDFVVYDYRTPVQ